MFSTLFLPFLACTQTTWSSAEDCYTLSKGKVLLEKYGGVFKSFDLQSLSLG